MALRLRGQALFLASISIIFFAVFAYLTFDGFRFDRVSDEAVSIATPEERDARRVDDIKAVQTAIETYRQEKGRYPDQKIGETMLPPYPLPADGNCAEIGMISYNYSVDELGGSYRIDFCLGGMTGILPPGPRLAAPNGIH